MSRLVSGSVSAIRIGDQEECVAGAVTCKPANLIELHQPNPKGGAQNDRVLFTPYFRIQQSARFGEIGCNFESTAQLATISHSCQLAVEKGALSKDST